MPARPTGWFVGSERNNDGSDENDQQEEENAYRYDY